MLCHSKMPYARGPMLWSGARPPIAEDTLFTKIFHTRTIDCMSGLYNLTGSVNGGVFPGCLQCCILDTIPRQLVYMLHAHYNVGRSTVVDLRTTQGLGQSLPMHFILPDSRSLKNQHVLAAGLMCRRDGSCPDIISPVCPSLLKGAPVISLLVNLG
jgi:hypothetical protein